jgi:hypothetical protein
MVSLVESINIGFEFSLRSAIQSDTGTGFSRTGADAMTTLTKSLIFLVLMISLAGCATPGYYGYNHYPYRGALTGAAVGAAGGALLGHAADDGHGNGALLGGTVGALVGGATGYYLDQKRRESYRDRSYYDGDYGHPRHHQRRYR